MNIFRTATGQAIRDIISDHSQENRFGRTLTDDDLDAICERVVDLFEMTLNLRARLSGNTEPVESQPRTQQRSLRWDEEPAQMPMTKAAADVYDFSEFEQQRRRDALPDRAPQHNTEPEYKLTRRQRTTVSAEEQQRLMRQAERSAAVQRHAP